MQGASGFHGSSASMTPSSAGNTCVCIFNVHTDHIGDLVQMHILISRSKVGLEILLPGVGNTVLKWEVL